MQFLTVALVASIVAFTSAAPTLTARAPIAVKAPRQNTDFEPDNISQYTVWTGAVEFSTAGGAIFKDGHTSDITTLVTFTFPPESVGKTCTFAFYASLPVGGTGEFDVFTTLAPVTESTSTWPSGNMRDQALGRMVIEGTGNAVLVADVAPASLLAFPCPVGVKGFEMVGAGDNVDIEWEEDMTGGISMSYH